MSETKSISDRVSAAIAYLTDQGLVAPKAEAPLLVDAKALDDFADRLDLADPKAREALTLLRNLSPQEIKITLPGAGDAKPSTVTVDIVDGLLPGEAKAIRTALKLTDSHVALAAPQLTLLRTLSRKSGNENQGITPALLARLLRLEGASYQSEGITLKVAFVPVHKGDLNGEDLQFMASAYGIKTDTGVFDRDNFLSLQRALSHNELSDGESKLLERVRAAAQDHTVVVSEQKKIVVDLDRPTPRTLRGLFDRYGVAAPTKPEDFAALAETIAKTAKPENKENDLATLGDLVSCSGKTIAMPAGKTVKNVPVQAQLSAADVKNLQDRLGIRLDDKPFDGEQLQRVLQRMATSDFTPGERAIWQRRFLLNPQPYTITVGAKRVTVDVKSLSEAQLKTLRDVWDIAPKLGEIGREQLNDLRSQLRANAVPRGLSNTLDDLKENKQVKLPRLQTLAAALKPRIEQALEALKDKPDAQEQAELEALQGWLEQGLLLTGNGTAPIAVEHWALMKKLLTRDPGRIEPADMILELAFAGAKKGQRLELDGKPVVINTPGDETLPPDDVAAIRRHIAGYLQETEGNKDPKVKVWRQEAQALNDRLDTLDRHPFNMSTTEDRAHFALAQDLLGRSGRDFSRSVSLVLERGRVGLRYEQRNEKTGDSHEIVLRVRDDGIGASLGWRGQLAFRLQEDRLWLLATGAAAIAYDRNPVGKDINDHFGLQAEAGLKIRALLSERFGVVLEAEVHGQGRATFLLSQNTTAADIANTQGFVNGVQPLVAKYKAKAAALMQEAQTAVASLQTTSAAVAQNIQQLQTVLQTLFQQLGSSNPLQAAGTFLQASQQLNQLSGSIPQGSQAAQQLSDVATKLGTLISDCQTDFTNLYNSTLGNLKNPSSAGGGISLGGSVGVRGRIQLGDSGAMKYLRPSLTVSGSAPLLTGTNDLPLLTGDWSVNAPRVWADLGVALEIDPWSSRKPGLGVVGYTISAGVQAGVSIPGGKATALPFMPSLSVGGVFY